MSNTKLLEPVCWMVYWLCFIFCIGYGDNMIYPLKPENLDLAALDFGLQDKNSKKLLYEYTIRVFPDGTKIIKK